jgi:hypothetical protein
LIVLLLAKIRDLSEQFTPHCRCWIWPAHKQAHFKLGWTAVHDSSKATVIDGATVHEELEQQLRININNP